MTTRALLIARTSGHWTAGDKYKIVRDISNGTITKDQVLQTFPDMSLEELNSWFTHLEKRGINGLRARRLQEDRNVRRKENDHAPASGAPG